MGIKDYLHYDPETGDFRWIKRTGPRCSLTKPAGYINHWGYWAIGFAGKPYYAHRLAYWYMEGWWPEEVDHINGITTDNRWENIREATSQINKENQRSKKNKLLGVHVNKQGKKNPFRAAICHNRKQIHIGVYRTEKEAHEAYLQVKRRLHKGCTI